MNKKSRTQETPNLPTVADSSTNIFFIRRLQDLDLFRVLINETTTDDHHNFISLMKTLKRSITGNLVMKKNENCMGRGQDR